jgi:hypothetical protein
MAMLCLEEVTLKVVKTKPHKASPSRMPPQMAFVCRLPDPAWMLDLDEPFMKRRDRLPEPAQEPKSISVWELIKEFVGKDLARVRTRTCTLLDNMVQDPLREASKHFNGLFT